MRTVDILIDKSITEYIEQLRSEVNVLWSMIRNMSRYVDTYSELESSPVFRAYHKKYKEKNTELEMVKDNLIRQSIPECILEHDVVWALDFYSSIVTVTVKCECLDKLSYKEISEMMLKEV